jgi:hypothetical protein
VTPSPSPPLLSFLCFTSHTIVFKGGPAPFGSGSGSLIGQNEKRPKSGVYEAYTSTNFPVQPQTFAHQMPGYHDVNSAWNTGYVYSLPSPSPSP